MTTETLVEAHGLTKRYGDFVAVDSLNLRLQQGEVYGFLGPNGSGKSTTILMMLGLTEPTEGTVRVCGFDPTRQPLEVKRRVGYLPESVGFYNDLTGSENLQYTAHLNNIPREESKRRIADVLEMVTLSSAARQPVGQYSRGMRQRLGLADVLLKDPVLIILDDPTLGLDPTGIQWLLGLIEEMSTQRQITVFLSSHQLMEVQRVCHRIGIMSAGNIAMEGDLRQLMAQQESGGYRVEIEVQRLDQALVEGLRSLPGVREVEAAGNYVRLESDEDVRAGAVELVTSHGATLLEVRSRNQTLEDIYLRYFQGA